MIKFMSICSGSSGNCYLLMEEGRPGVLIDAGASKQKLNRVFKQMNLSFDSFTSILVTHDHLDHIRNLGGLCSRFHKPVYATATLHAALASHPFTRFDVPQYRRDLAENDWTTVAEGIDVKWFEVPHDATQTVGFVIRIGGRQMVHITDCGRMTEEALAYAREADTVVIESNYDVQMLIGGPYPYELKMRICKGNGHLSNDECALAVSEFWHPGLKNLFLCHISEHNNTPELALETVRKSLADAGADLSSINLRALPHRNPTPLINL